MRKIALLFFGISVMLLYSGVIYADEQVPSDLALDLALAEKNPAPQQQQIIGSETATAQETTSVGKTTIQPEPQLAPEVAEQPASATDHPEQTTSAQVQETSVPADSSVNQGTTDKSQSGSQQPDLNNNLVPGTTVVGPDDNAAPATLPTTPVEEPPTPTPRDQPVTSPPDETTRPSPVAAPPADSGSSSNETPPVVTSPETNSPPESNPQPENPQPDSTVQGVSTQRLDLWGQMVNFFRGLIR